MQCDFHISGRRFCATAIVRSLCAVSLLAILAVVAVPALAQKSPTQPIGRIEGADVTVDGGPHAGMATADSPAGIYVSNGSTVTVHSGNARLALDGGGVLDICGPAEFTVLTSGGEITIALNFGRLHVELPAHTSLKVFSPTLIATPIDINGGSRDVTVGLDLNDSFCVLATSGAVQLEQQFTGEKLIVPQAGQFFLNGGKLLPVASKTGSCGCTPMDEHSIPRPRERLPIFARTAPTQPVILPETPEADGRPTSPHASEELPPESLVQPGAVFVIPINPDEEQPLPQPQTGTAGPAPQVGGRLRGNVSPALAFMASRPPAPDEAEPEMMLLVSEARESPDWEFDGRVDPPPFVAAMQHALGEQRVPPQKQDVGDRPSAVVALPKEKKRGFWASLKGLFVGKVEADDTPQAGVH
jgi:hypothetical protein